MALFGTKIQYSAIGKKNKKIDKRKKEIKIQKLIRKMEFKQ